MREFLDEEGVPYEVVPAFHPDQYGKGLQIAGGREEAEAITKRATEKWIAAGRPYDS
jgi:hypothetical protein